MSDETTTNSTTKITTTITPTPEAPKVIKKMISAGTHTNVQPALTDMMNEPTGDTQKTPEGVGVETKGEDVVKPEPKSEESQLSRLSKVERRIKEREAQVSAQLAALNAREEKVKHAEKWSELPGQAKTDPVKVLKELGIEFEDIAQAIINGGLPPEEKIQSNKIDELSAKVAAWEEAQAELRRTAIKDTERQAVIDYVKDGHDFINANADDYELVRAKGNAAYDEAWQLAEEVFKETGEVPDIKEVMKTLEGYYQSEAEAAFKASKKLAARLGLPDASLAGLTPESKENLKQIASAVNSAKPIAPTLGGKMSRAVPGIPPAELAKLSEKDKLAAIIAWGNAQLAKK